MAQRYHHNLEHQAAPAFFARGPSPFARLVFFSALSLTLMATDSRLHYLISMRQQMVAFMTPLQMLANAPSSIFSHLDDYFSGHHYLLSNNQALRERILMQQVELQRLNTLTLENTHLRQLLNANKALMQTATLAEIMHVGRDPFTKKIVVNRGEVHAVKAGEAVVDETGVIGQVTRIYPLSSEVTLITDKSLAIPVQVERNGLRAIAFGHGRDNTLDLPYLPTNVDVKRGDKLVTSGIDGIYPAGLAVAVVSDIEITADSPFARIVCVPTGGVENHRQVLLVGIPTASQLAATARTPVVPTASAGVAADTSAAVGVNPSLPVGSTAATSAPVNTLPASVTPPVAAKPVVANPASKLQSTAIAPANHAPQ